MNTHPSAAPSLSVSVVVHHSDLAWLRQTLRSLHAAAALALADGAVAEVQLWVLNNSLDAAYAAALQGLLQPLRAQERPGLHWLTIELTQNAGFGAAHNRALLDTTSDYHLVLNPDVDLAGDALVRALALMQADPRVVALGPRVRGADGQQEFLCKDYPSVLVLLLRGFAPYWLRQRFGQQLDDYELRPLMARNRMTEVPLLSGCFLLMRAAPARRVRGFDTAFFLYFEDFDLCMRLREAGTLVYAPQVSIVHYGGRAAAKGWRHLRWFVSSAARFFGRYGWRWW